ncbi:hypothetical protein BCR33DRAFT_717596 [Rhizoclosmatium globosum]|uniref:Uncharacterized protein n=1 Tax=Rhizoclosmatium globosum TaxID=329046 RepID=A0A1Y2C8V0_9FUNG|nr:hypothetical protein BCR33DRAFT_717596 [Rhizoclosmatium globosum]|eukprot:ORY43366.1 hypothetical protein BCR33DRAFT_717596 [Rhizoclosmatium globosum]
MVNKHNVPVGQPVQVGYPQRRKKLVHVRMRSLVQLEDPARQSQAVLLVNIWHPMEVASLVKQPTIVRMPRRGLNACFEFE